MPTMPPDAPTMKSMQEQINALKREVRALQRKAQEEPVQQPREDRIVYSHKSAPSVGTVSPPYRYRRSSGYLTSVEVSAGVPGTSETTVRVYRQAIGSKKQKNLATVTLVEDDDYEIADDLMAGLDDLDRVFVVADKVGDAVEDLTITLTFMESVE